MNIVKHENTIILFVKFMKIKGNFFHFCLNERDGFEMKWEYGKETISEQDGCRVQDDDKGSSSSSSL